MSFGMEKLVGLNAVALDRVRRTDEAPPRVSVYDVICAVTGKKSSNAANTFRSLEARFPDVSGAQGAASVRSDLHKAAGFQTLHSVAT